MDIQQNSFITNQDKLLSEIINGILPKTHQVDILVGYFYYSGYSELSENLKDKRIRILVGLDVDTQITKHIREIDSLTREQKSRGQLRDDYFNQFVNLFNESDFLDSKEKLQSFALFYNKIKDGTLEIRKTEDPCHAKMYLFSYSDSVCEAGEQPGCVITGSSNLSYSGLKGRLEINARFNDKQTYLDGEKIFDALWETSVVIADAENVAEFDEKVIKRIWYEKMYAPYQMYIRVLKEYFTIPTRENVLTPYDITDGKFSNLKYQTDAVQLALNAIENHNGAIVADVVGLGKSVIASTVARNLKLRTIVICPPHLVPQWESYKDEFQFTATVFSGGKIEQALSHYTELVKDGEKFLIIVDEAHRYKNEYTQDYAALHNLCSGNKVLLLTATPFNNRPEDIYSMLKLFQIPSKSTLKTVENLGRSFRDLIDAYKKLTKNQREGKLSEAEVKLGAESIAKSIRSIISPLVIRRSRIDLQQIPEYIEDLKRQHIQLTLPNDPEELEYDLSAIKELYLDTLDRIDGSGKDDGINRFKAARYSPILYVMDEYKEKLKKEIEAKTGMEYNLLVGRQSNISRFMRKLLVTRFESSVAAFRASLDYMIRSSENILEWVKRCNKIPVYKKGNIPLVDDFYESTDDGLTEIDDVFEKYSQKGFFEINVDYVNEHFVEDVAADIELLKAIKEKWFGINNKITFDPKLEAFKEILRDKLKNEPKRKLIVFSEFADTVDYVGQALIEDGFRVFKYTSMDSSSTNKSTIRANFDAGLKTSLQRDDYDILVATDAISEGYNLHRAGAIINYDIPYNPTRVIQRIGRINRINKKVFDELFIYNYFPTDVGESETRTKEISTLKMAMIHAIMGEDTKALTKDEELRSFFKERYRAELAKDEVESWDSPYRKLLNELKGSDVYEEAMEIPHRAKTGRKAEKPKYGVLMFGKKGNDYVFKIGDEFETEQLTAEQALSMFSADEQEPAVKLSKNFDKSYQNVKTHLFEQNKTSKNAQDLVKAIAKIKLMLQTSTVSKDYLKDLLVVTQNDGLSGYELRFINGLKQNEYAQLPHEIDQKYLSRLIAIGNKIDDEQETLILSEEIMH